MGDPAWVGIAVTLFIAIMSALWGLVRKISGVEATLIKRIDEVATQQTQYRHDANNRMSDNIAQLEDKLDDAVRDADRAHRELMIQVKDMALTMRDNFVSKPDLRDTLSTIHELLTDLRKEVGGIHTRVDDLYKQGRG